MAEQRDEDRSASTPPFDVGDNGIVSNGAGDETSPIRKQLWITYQEWLIGYGSLRCEQRQAMKEQTSAVLQFLTPAEYLKDWMWDVMITCIKDGNLWSPYEANLAFSHLEQYALNLAWYPWKREIQLLNVNCGFFATRVSRVISDAVKVLEQLGYEETFQDIYTLSHPVNRDVVHLVAFECFKAAAECSYQEKLLAAFLKGNPHLSWEQKCEAARCVLKCRENGFSEMEECFEAIWDDLRVMKASTTTTCDESSPLGIKSFSHESLMSTHLPMNGGETMEKYNHGFMVMSGRHFDSQQSSTENLLTVHSDGSYRSSERPKLTAATFQPLAKPFHGIGDELSAEIIKEKKPSSRHSLIQYEEERSDSPNTTTAVGDKIRMNKRSSSQGEKTSNAEKGKFKTLIEKVSKRESHSRDGHKMLQNVVRQFSSVGHRLTAINAKKRIGELLSAAENLRSAPNKRRTTTWYTDAADDSVDAVSIKSEQGLGDHVVSSSRSYASHGSLKLTKTSAAANRSRVAGYGDGLSLTCPRCHWSSGPCEGDFAVENNIDEEHSSHHIPPVPPPPIVMAKRINRQSSLGEYETNHQVVHANFRQSGRIAPRLPPPVAEPKPPADALMDELVQKLALRRSRIEAGEVTFDSFGKPTGSIELDSAQSAVGALSLGQSSVSACNSNGSGESVDDGGGGAAVTDTGCVLPECSSPVGAVSLSRTSSRLNPLAGGLTAIAEDEELHNADGETSKSSDHSSDSMCSLTSNGTVLPARPHSALDDVAMSESTMAVVEVTAADNVAMQRPCVHCSTDSEGAMCCACCSCGDAVGPTDGMSGADGEGSNEMSRVACMSATPLALVNGSSLTPTLVQ